MGSFAVDGDRSNVDPLRGTAGDVDGDVRLRIRASRIAALRFCASASAPTAVVSSLIGRFGTGQSALG